MGFQQGLSGLNATSKNLEVIGNNIANANTYGSKVARAEFNDVYAAALSGAGTNTIGIGTNLAAVAQQFTQGNISTTSNPMDLAINGGGFFQVTDGKSPISYTRNGQFKVDREGYIVNNNQQRLMGYPADGLGRILPGQADAIRLPTGGIAPNATTTAELEMNLDSGSVITQPAQVARNLAQSSADDLTEQAASAQTAMTAARTAMAAVDPMSPLSSTALAAVIAAQTEAAEAATAAAAAADGYAGATQAGAATSAASAETAAQEALASAQAALTAMNAAWTVEQDNSSLGQARIALEGALQQAKDALTEARLHSAAVDAVPGATSGPQIDFLDNTTFNNTTTMTMYDAKGAEVDLTLYFQKQGADTWNVYARANDTTVAGSESLPQPFTTLTFSSDGARVVSPTGAVTLDIPVSTNSEGVETMAISGVELQLGSTTQFDQAFGVTNSVQDGFSAGLLTAIAIEPNGIVSARYSNGQSRPAGQIELATFRNPQGLQPTGDNNWARSYTSGDAVVGVPGDGNLGLLQAGALEESNVDITSELVNMITAQRIYQANAQSIKTIDQVLQTIVNLR